MWDKRPVFLVRRILTLSWQHHKDDTLHLFKMKLHLYPMTVFFFVGVTWPRCLFMPCFAFFCFCFFVVESSSSFLLVAVHLRKCETSSPTWDQISCAETLKTVWFVWFQTDVHMFVLWAEHKPNRTQLLGELGCCNTSTLGRVGAQKRQQLVKYRRTYGRKVNMYINIA